MHPTERVEPRDARRLARSSAQFEIEPDPRRLRDSVGRLSGLLSSLTPDPARKVRLLATELIARSSDPRRDRGGSIRLDIRVMSGAVRVEASGPGLVMPSRHDDPDRQRERLFPAWVIDDIADRWGLDRRAQEPAMWFEVSLPAAG